MEFSIQSHVNCLIIMLSNILADLKDSLTAKDRPVLLRYANRAYKEIYDTYDLPGSIFDEYFEVDGTDGQVVLPEYVDQIRGAGAETGKHPIKVTDFRSGYRVTPVFQQPYEWRVRGNVPLCSQMDATDQLRIVFSGAEAYAVNVYIRGQTSTSSDYTETVMFNAGETEKVTVSQWVADNPYALTMVAKDVPTANDVTVFVNTTDTEVSKIRNRLLEARYQLLQLSDINPPSGAFSTPFEGARIVYKKTFVPLYFDTDEVVYPKIEEAVIWKARELWFGRESTADSLKSAQYAYQKCQALLNTVMINQESESEKRATFARNPYENAHLYTRRTYGRFNRF